MKWRSAVLVLSASVALAGCGGLAPQVREESSPAETVEESREARAPGTYVSVEEPSQENGAVSGQVEQKALTREKVLELAGRTDLSWKDFEDYSSEDIGSGLLILAYQIDKDFSLLIGGRSADQELMYIRLTAGDDYIDLGESSAQAVQDFFENHGSRKEYVGIRGHIKEIKGDEALVSSDTDQFPGTFWVTGILELAAGEELKGGTSVFVLMEDAGKKAEDGIRIFQGRQIVALSEEEERSQVDTLLTSAPSLTLTDVLSSRYDPIEVQPGSFTWGVDEGGEVRELVACGAAPLDHMALGDKAVKLPDYNNMDQVFYSLSTVFAPDQLMIRQWKISDRGRGEAKEESVTTLYYIIPIVGLEKDKVYEFVTEWEKDNLEKRGFWGRASYVLSTE